MGNTCAKSPRTNSIRSNVTNRYDTASAAGGAVGRGEFGSFTFALRQKFGIIPDSFETIEQVQEKLREVGLESSNLIVGVDFTKSNEWTGKRTFNGESLHAIRPGRPNPYESAIEIIGQTLAVFDEDGQIPCFGFGDVSTHDTGVFSFNDGNRPCDGFEEALRRYRTIAPRAHLSGPTSFAPVIEAAVRIVEESGGQYHVLLIIADGQVTRSVDQPVGSLSRQEQATVDAIVAASNYALSIVMVGVGDGPWDTMNEFDDALPQRKFDNFQFVDFSRIMASTRSPQQRAAHFALSALMEVPYQYKACAEQGLLGKRVGRMPPVTIKSPPGFDHRSGAAAAAAPAGDYEGYGGGNGSYGYTGGVPSAPSAEGGSSGGGRSPMECPVCMANPNNMAFQCGHQTCSDCGNQIRECPICRSRINMRIKLYN
eukprot:TRINITY_DN1479_c0_g1_i3.p1 TRINITY_DN1479_c0_g1~~TRINITY_DN1479_c0_g1_i3.p1  ORF type:complete len:426 (-),score=3.60 TRINITY_DN1479_c0_g1_i3:169-1446(-)